MIAGKKLVDLFCRGLYMVDGDVMVHGVNDACQELAHISLFDNRGVSKAPDVCNVRFVVTTLEI